MRARFHLLLAAAILLFAAPLGHAFDESAAPPTGDAPTAEEAVSAPIVLGGQIVDDADRPIAGARIELMHEIPGKVGVTIAETTTDDAGRWMVSLDAAAYDFDLWVHHRDYVDSRFGPITDPPERELRDQTAVTRLERGTSVSATVTAAGRPVPGARLLVGWLAQDEDAALTNAEGQVRLDGLPPARHEVAVFAEGWAPQVASVDTTGGSAELAVALDRGGTLLGEVVDEQGKPVPDVEVWQIEWTVMDSHFLERTVKTDTAGHFQLDLLPRRGTVTMQISRRGYLEVATRPLVPRESAYRFVLPRPTVVEGTVIDDTTGMPIRQFEVSQGTRWQNQDYVVWRSLPPVEDAEGRFRCEQGYGAPPYPGIAVRISAPGYLPHETAMRMVGERGDPIEVRLRRAPPIAGTVVSVDGGPVSGAQVAWIAPGRVAYVADCRLSDNSNRPEYVVATDEGGNFTLPPSERDATILVLHADGYAVRESADHARDPRIALTPWARVEFALRTGAEHSRTATVALLPVDERWTGLDARVRFNLHAVTDADGNAAIEHVPAIALRAGWIGRGILSHVATLTPEPGTTHALELGTGGVVVSGILTKPGDVRMPLFSMEAGAHRYYTQVVAVPLDELDLPGIERTNFMAVVERDGAFRIRGLPPSEYELVAQVFPPQLVGSCSLPIPLARATTRLSVAAGDGREIALPPLSLTAVRGILPGEPLPDLPSETLSGTAIDWGALRGQVVVLDFWASWCGPCLAAVPQVREVFDEHGDDGLTILGVNIDYLNETGLQTVAEHDMPWEHLALGPWGEDNPILRELGVSNIPSLWIVGPDGTVLARDVPIDQLADAVRQALGR